MHRLMCKGKIHKAYVTDCRPAEVGCLYLDTLLMQQANIRPYEMIRIAALDGGAVWKTYAIGAEEGSGTVALQGPPAKLFQAGDAVQILSLGLFDDEEVETLQPKLIFVDEHNLIRKVEIHDLL